MSRPVCVLLLLASCGTVESDADPDGRPLDFEYIVGAVFAPSCGQTQCHSRFHQAGGLVFDNPDDARVSLLIPKGSATLLRFEEASYDPRPKDIGYKPNLISWVTDKFPLTKPTNSRMPFDAPLPRQDVDLLRVWIHRAPEVMGDPPGASAKGAQCNPANYGGLACNDDEIVMCNADFNFGEPIEACPSGCKITDICDDKPPDYPDRPCNVDLRRIAECQ